VKIRVDRPDRAAAGDIFQKYLTPDLPIAAARNTDRHGGIEAAVDTMIASARTPCSSGRDQRIPRVSYANGERRSSTSATRLGRR